MRTGLLLFALAVLWAATTRAELKPDEVAIIAVRSSRQSRELAEYYGVIRGISNRRICYIDVERNKQLDRERWELVVKPAIRNWLLYQKLENQVRCLVTVWDVPLKIGPAPPHHANARRAFLQADRALRARRALDLIDDGRRTCAEKDAAPGAELDTTADAGQLGKELESAIQSAKRRIAVAEPAQTAAAKGELVKVVTAAGGLSSVLQMMALQTAPNPEAKIALDKQLERGRGRLQGLQEGMAALEQMPDSPEREEQILALVETARGLIGSLAWIDERLKQLEKNETYSGFDSELSLLFWPRYSLHRWQPNLLHYRYDGSPARTRRVTLMVSRLEAPTAALTKRLIDDAVQAEREGLQGTAYFDARAIRVEGQAPPRGSTGEYDQALRNVASVLEKHTQLPVVLDDEKALFQPGSCPNAALYCGWYSLAKYVDAFDFNQGAVGYHIASSEASTLRAPDSQVWCKRMLEDGICATLGPTHEPYLAAFPRPDEFFVSLLSGRFSLAECYYRTKPFNSWVMVLAGDPLYNPYRRDPAIERKRLPAHLQRLIPAE